MLPLAELPSVRLRVRSTNDLKQAAFAFFALTFALMLCAQNVVAQKNPGVTGIAGRSDTRAAQADKKVTPDGVSKMVREGKLPPSRLFDYATADGANSYHLGELPASVLQQGDDGDKGKRGAKRLRIGVARDLNVTLDALKSASVFSLPEGETRIFSVVSDKAKQVRLFFTNVNIPEGGRLYVYSRENPDEVFGPLTKRGLNDTGEFWTPPMNGDAAVVELYLPSGVRLESTAFTVTKVNHIYLDAATIGASDSLKLDGFDTFAAGTCNLDVRSEWAEVAKSVGRMQFIAADNSGSYVCTGTLLNAVNNDQTPYFLTANHCISQPSEAQSLSVRWNYNSPGTFNTAPSSYGATLLRTGEATDYTLLMINGALPNGLYWSGWSPNNINSNSAVTGIHHPKGDYKRISFGTKTSNSTAFYGKSGHAVRWNSGGGTTEGGSSGSGLFFGSPSDARVIGTLMGGAALCENQTGADYYARFDITYPFLADLLAGGSDDVFEDNDTQATARTANTLIGTGINPGMIVKSTDEDWYRFTVPANSVFNVETAFTNQRGNIDLEIYRASDSAPAVSARTGNDNEYIVFNNFSDVAAEITLRVFLASDTRQDYGLAAIIINNNACEFGVSPLSVNAAANGTTTSAAVSSRFNQCTWSARSNVEWITITSGANGSGNSNVTYQVAANTTRATRTGTLTVAGQTVTVTQSGQAARKTRVMPRLMRRTP